MRSGAKAPGDAGGTGGGVVRGQAPAGTFADRRA
jgi:hypothetical protein